MILTIITFTSLLSQTTINFFSNFNVEKYYYDIQNNELNYIINDTNSNNNNTDSNNTDNKDSKKNNGNNFNHKENNNNNTKIISYYLKSLKKIDFINKLEKEKQFGTYFYILNLINKNTSDLNYKITELLYNKKEINDEDKIILGNYLKIQENKITNILPLSLKIYYSKNNSLLFKDIKQLIENLSIIYYYKVNVLNKNEDTLIVMYESPAYNISNFIKDYKQLLNEYNEIIDKLENKKTIILEKIINKEEIEKNKLLLNKIKNKVLQLNKEKDNIKRQYYLLIIFNKIKNL